MKKIVWFMHVSLDGFVAGPNGEMNWIIVDDAIFDYAGARTENADMALYGRVTWQMMEAYWPTAGDQPNASKHDREHSAWYKQVQKVVLSNTVNDPGKDLTRFVGANAAATVAALKNGGDKEIIIFGSPGAGKFLLTEGLIDELWLFVNPILVGKGLRLFPELETPAALRLVESHAFGNGVVCLHYEYVR